MNIFLLHITKPFSEYEKYLPFAALDRQAKIRRLKHDSIKSAALMSHLFARHKISSDLNIPFEKLQIKEGEFGKPYVEHADYHFSISHCDNIIAFVSHTTPIGIDIQKITADISPAIRFFTKNEQSYVSSDPSRFFEIWTKKEAYIKMLGTGLSTPLSSFDVLSEGVKPLLFSTKTDGFAMSICAESIDKINILDEYV